jgi:hypothetical protein
MSASAKIPATAVLTLSPNTASGLCSDLIQ